MIKEITMSYYRDYRCHTQCEKDPCKDCCGYNNCDCCYIREDLDYAASYSDCAITSVGKIFDLFAVDNTCKKLCCSEELLKETEDALYCLRRALYKLYSCYNGYCYYCYNKACSIIEKIMYELEDAICYYQRFLEILRCYDCDKEECALFENITLALEKLAKVDINVQALLILFKDCYCEKKDKC